MRTGRQILASCVLVLGMVCAMLALTASQAFAQQKRLAFVIGNGAYQNVPRLPNALNDATSIRAVLQEAGFEVVPATDATLAGMRASLDSFIGKVQQAGSGATALVYYAGHAIQLDGANYLLPVDVRPETAANIAGQALSLSDILKRLDATGAVAKIAILDACRDNPFAAREMARGLALQMVDGATEAPRSEAGLARVDSRSGTFVAFATSPGATAADGAGSNSPFTEAFLRLAREPGQPVEQLFRRIRLAVHDATNGTQIPWDTSSLITDFAFFQRPAAPATPATPTTPPVAGAAPSEVSLTLRPTTASLRSLSPADAYRSAIAWDRRDIYRSVLEIHPEGERAPRLHRIVTLRTEETAWAETVRAGDAESLLMFARLFPGSQHAAEATRLARTAPSRNQVRTVAAVCPVCPAAAAPRTRRADYSPRGVAPARSGPARQAPAAPPPPPVLAPVLPYALPARPRWTGFYVGGSLGGGRQSDRTTVGGPFGGPMISPTNTTTNTTTTTTTTTTTSTDNTDSIPVTTTVTSTVTSTDASSVTTVGTPILAPWAIDPGSVPRNLTPEGGGAVGGAQFGFNYQIGAVVIGAETDLSATRLGGSETVSANTGTGGFTTRASNDLSMLGTVRVRAGIALGDFLIYGTGGYAYGLVEQKGSITPDNPQTTSGASGSRSGLSSGWALGGGIEYALAPGMSVRLDYTHYELGQKQLMLRDFTGLAPGQYATMRARTTGDIVKAGFNFGF